jgi:hypothetical protein
MFKSITLSQVLTVYFNCCYTSSWLAFLILLPLLLPLRQDTCSLNTSRYSWDVSANGSFLTCFLLLPFGVSDLTNNSPIYLVCTVLANGATQWHILLLSPSTGSDNSRYNFPVWLFFLNSNHVKQHLCFFITIYCTIKKGNIHPWRARRGLEVWLYSFFNLGARWKWVMNNTSRPL